MMLRAAEDVFYYPDVMAVCVPVSCPGVGIPLARIYEGVRL